MQRRPDEKRMALAAPDSFKGSSPASEIAEAIVSACEEVGWLCDACPMSDGGEGFSQVMAAYAPSGEGTWETSVVTGPLGDPVRAKWWWAPPEAVVEVASASGLVLAGGAVRNDPVNASSKGTGELIAAALGAGAARVVVGLGGSGTTDGGLGAVEALIDAGGIGRAEVVAACDVTTGFVDAASLFAPQKGASPEQVVELRARLEHLVVEYRRRFGVDVTSTPGAGAAGGLGGGLAALGARLVSGFDLAAQRAGLERRVAASELVISGEGSLDSSSWSGKVVGGVVASARRADVPVLLVVGQVGGQGAPTSSAVEVLSLAELFGAQRAFADTAECVAQAVRDALITR